MVIGIDLNEVVGELPGDLDKKIILAEHLNLIPDNPDGEEGIFLSVFSEHDDLLHIKEHLRFLTEHENTISIQAAFRMRQHIKKHKLQIEEREALDVQ